MSIKTIRIIGMGAVGMLYGYQMYQHGADMSFLVDPERYQRYQVTDFTINDRPWKMPLISSDDAKPVDLLIVATKYPGLSSALETMASSIDDHTIIVSLLNGITSEAMIKERYPEAHVLYSVAQGMDSMKFGHALHFHNMGQICIGTPDEAEKASLEAVEACFEAYGVPYTHEEDIMHRLYSKFMLNVGINQTCMVYGIGYGKALVPASLEMMTFISAMREAMLVAQKEGVNITEDDLNGYVELMRTLAPDNMPSMAQDRVNKNPSEVELFSGTVMALAKKHHLYVPVNEYLYRCIHDIEAQYDE